ncbi:helix-turn-helix transcriptional regulator [Flammeovirga aprica]|uniref:Helix-turn-helix transcriptional regulator n=1 Tax=Flammeovirga aprica JL-4 TaxID=694437 RepID=A0A7X9XCZ9_9BACT|nr:helix-turn-helix transcriptional regulator [Flammeovirga aprica]NME72268.1 helix-turn-helix transcriptional regulator [Flammeovirga aprica JL-4]
MEELHIYSNNFKQIFEDLSSIEGYGQDKNQIKIKNEGGSIEAKGYQINDELEITYFEGFLSKPLKLIRKQQKENAYVVVFFLTPFSLTKEISDNAFTIQPKKYWSNLKRDEVFYFDANIPVRFVTIKHSTSFLEKYNINNHSFISQLIETQEPFIIYETISLQSSKVLEEIMNCDFHNELDLLKLDYLTYQLLYIFASKVIHRFGIQTLPQTYSEIDLERVFKVKEFIEENCSEMTISPKEIAEQANCSYSKIRKLYKEITGDTLLEAINNSKLTKAHQWLKSEKYNVTECTYNLGFSSITHFGKIFKKKYGYLPSELYNKGSFE